MFESLIPRGTMDRPEEIMTAALSVDGGLSAI